ncbi:MAG: Stk1 family PASTA domain-containing Ser/Thr kinase [Clostridiales bacterium]|nr:Stk1 family PASTA domain-containing Ser/Thr kinase [Clostridiales bacterium]
MENYEGKILDGRYEIRETIGIGGMAVVYKAYDNIDDRIVAVKILKDEFLANEEFRRRFKNESKAIAVLSHPNIVKVYDVSYGDRLQYIVMEYVEGITLKEYIQQQGKIDIKEAVHFTTQILRALQHAHDKGIVHRDVKPQNIMLLRNGTVKVTDFGIARFSRSETRTMTENAIGSVHYISPEQARGDITDDKADIYSVGVVMYEMVTGQLPFQSDNTVSVAIMQLQSTPKRPSALNPHIPIGLEQIILRAMRKSPAERYQSVAEMLLAIDEFKRNPSVRFDYNYFVDDEPTKYVKRPNNYRDPQAANNTNRANKVEDDSYDNDDDNRSRSIPIITGIVVGLVVVIGLVFGLLIFTGFFEEDKIEVPDFLNKNYYFEIENNSEYKDFKFKIEQEQNSKYENGIVFKQDPTKGQKVSKGKEITLYVASNAKKTVVPDVVGRTFSDAKDIMAAAGLKVYSVLEYSTTEEHGTVIRTTPEKDTEVDNGTTVTLVIANDEDENATEVPNIVGWSLENARGMLESVGLTLDENVKKEDSDKEYGIVISQSISDKKVPKGTKISVVISSGIPAASEASVSVKLPNLGSGVDGNIKVYLDNVIVSDLSDKIILLNGKDYNFKVKGSGTNKALEVYVDGNKIYDCTIDFTKKPPELSNVQTYDYDSSNKKAFVPDVVGNSRSKAVQSIKAAGFPNINVIEEVTYDSEKDGIVFNQDPAHSVFTKYLLSTPVTIYVYKYPYEYEEN